MELFTATGKLKKFCVCVYIYISNSFIGSRLVTCRYPNKNQSQALYSTFIRTANSTDTTSYV